MNIANKPHSIVLTPVRNEAWILRAFLTATSLWADKIIIADQMSTDGSRDIYKEFSKVVVVDNDWPQMHQAASRRLLFDKAREILSGTTNAILFALDADEFLAGDFLHSEDWNKIMNSEPDDAFCWRWMNLKEGDASQYSDGPHFYWAVHVSDTLWNGQFPDNFIHEWRLPWPPNCTKEKEFNLDNLRSIHFSRVNALRQANKDRFYVVSSRSANNVRYNNIVDIFRMYHKQHLEYHNLPNDGFVIYQTNGIDLWSLTNLQDEGEYYSQEVLKIFKQQGLERFAWLDIWDDGWSKSKGIKNPQKWYHKLFVRYMQVSESNRNFLVIRAIDKVLKMFYKLFVALL